MATDQINVTIPSQGATKSNWINLFFNSNGTKTHGLPTTDGNLSTPFDMVTRYLQLLLAVADVVAIVFVLLSAWQMFTAAGDATKYATAKKSLLYALLGVVIIMSMLYFIQIIKNAAGTLGG